MSLFDERFALHLYNLNAVPFNRLMDFAAAPGYRVERAPYREWLDGVRAEVERSPGNALYPLITTFGAQTSSNLTFDCAQMLAALGEAGLTYPAVDERLLAMYFPYFIDSGFLPEPHVSHREAKRQRG